MTDAAHKTLILGGVRSGKSRHAQQLASDSGLAVIYIATAMNSDDVDMQARIAAHRQHRPAHWQLVEEPLQLAAVLRQHASRQHCLLVECLTLWLTNLLIIDNDTHRLERECAALLAVLPTLPGRIILVGNETGLGIIPDNPLARRFGDTAGLLHQQLAALCDQVILTVAGIAMRVKGT